MKKKFIFIYNFKIKGLFFLVLNNLLFVRLLYKILNICNCFLMNKINLYIGNIYIKLISKFVNYYYWDYYIIIVWILLSEYKVLLLLFVLFLICVYSYI